MQISKYEEEDGMKQLIISNQIRSEKTTVNFRWDCNLSGCEKTKQESEDHDCKISCTCTKDCIAQKSYAFVAICCDNLVWS